MEYHEEHFTASVNFLERLYSKWSTMANPSHLMRHNEEPFTANGAQ